MRKPRDFQLGRLYAVTQRGNHAQWVYRDEADFKKCISLMRRYSRMHQVKIHGYCLLHNHGHWILEASTPDSISNFMRDLQGQYSRYLNRRYGTTPWILFAPLIETVQPAAFSRYLRKGPTNWTGRYDGPLARCPRLQGLSQVCRDECRPRRTGETCSRLAVVERAGALLRPGSARPALCRALGATLSPAGDDRR